MAQDGPSGAFERDATVSTLPLPDVHPAKREESAIGVAKPGHQASGEGGGVNQGEGDMDPWLPPLGGQNL